MDTRSKVVPLSQARKLLKTGEWTVIVGLFDPLTAAQAQRIENYKHGSILAIVLESEETLLPADARCHLVAALRSVDFVTSAANREWHSITPGSDSIHVVEDLAAERRRSEEFVQRIITRQGAAAS